jgi:CheY-like chemotaxis protein
VTPQRLLVVDDSPAMRELAAITFPTTTWHLDLAASGAEALLLARKFVPDVVLVNLVLPDMHAVKLCEQFAKDEKLAQVPVVVLSSKGKAAAEIFRSFESFFSCVAKPVNPAHIRAEVEAAVASRQPPKRSLELPPISPRKDVAAKAVYSLLRDALEHMPRWLKELGDASPPAFFARRLLTPELITRLVDALAPQLDAPPLSEPPRSDRSGFFATLNGWPLLDLVHFFESSGRTGELSLTCAGKGLLAYFRGGEIILVTSRDPADYVRRNLPSAASIAGLPRDALRAAENEQRVSGTPVFVTLAAGGHFPYKDLTDVLAKHGRKLLADASEATSGKCSWRELSELPAYVQAHGQRLSPKRPSALGAMPSLAPQSVSLEQMALERLREAPPTTLPDGDLLLVRVHGFSSRLRAFDLSDSERRVLSLVDGYATVAEIASRAKLPLDRAATLLAILCEVGLLSASTSGSRGDALQSASAVRSLAASPPASERSPGRRAD